MKKNEEDDYEEDDYESDLEKELLARGELKKGELKPCPFCGAKAKMMHGPGDSWVECTVCHASSNMHTMESISIEEWNRRVN